MRGRIERYQSEVRCHACNGFRLKETALAVKIDKLHIGEVCDKSIKELVIWFQKLEKKLTKKRKRKIQDKVMREFKSGQT